MFYGKQIINAVVEKYPFIDKNVGNDEVRLSFGNARPESENRVLGGVVSHEIFGPSGNGSQAKRKRKQSK